MKVCLRKDSDVKLEGDMTWVGEEVVFGPDKP